MITDSKIRTINNKERKKTRKKTKHMYDGDLYSRQKGTTLQASGCVRTVPAQRYIYLTSAHSLQWQSKDVGTTVSKSQAKLWFAAWERYPNHGQYESEPKKYIFLPPAAPPPTKRTWTEYIRSTGKNKEKKRKEKKNPTYFPTFFIVLLLFFFFCNRRRRFFCLRC